MNFIIKHIPEAILAIFIIALGFIGLSFGSTSQDVAQNVNSDLTGLASTYESQQFAGFEDGAVRFGYEVVQLIDQLENTNNPRMRAEVTTRSGDTTVYGYATPTDDTFNEYDENDPTDDDYILENDPYTVTEIRTSSNDILTGFELEYSGN